MANVMNKGSLQKRIGLKILRYKVRVFKDRFVLFSKTSDCIIFHSSVVIK